MRKTPLATELSRSTPRRKVSPIDAFELASRKFAAGENIEIATLAEELGIGRATLFRWIGSRDMLLGEIVWYRCALLWKDALERATDLRGADHAAEVTYTMMNGVLASEPLRQFLRRDPEYALRVLISKDSIVQNRMIDEVRKTIQQRVDLGELRPAMDVDDLAYIVVRIVESSIYSDQIAGRKPNVESARSAIHILVGAVADTAAATVKPRVSGKTAAAKPTTKKRAARVGA